MEPGQELDRLVAEKVMGWKRWEAMQHPHYFLTEYNQPVSTCEHGDDRLYAQANGQTHAHAICLAALAAVDQLDHIADVSKKVDA